MNGTMGRTAFAGLPEAATLRELRSVDLLRLAGRVGRALALQTVDQVRAWHDRACDRRILSRLTDRDFKDMGISRVQARAEMRKPFWVA